MPFCRKASSVDIQGIAVRIVKDGKEKIEPLGYSVDELIGLMEELERARIEKIKAL